MSDRTLESLDGVGEKRAELLRRHGYTSVESLARAEPKDLVEIKGIGPATATDLLASVVRVLDDHDDLETRASKDDDPATTTRRLGTPFSTVDRITHSPTSRRPKRETTVDPGSAVTSASTVRDSRRKTVDSSTGRIDPDRKSARSDDGHTHESGGNPEATVALAYELLSREADETGRIGRTPIDASNVDANVTIRFTPASRFDVDPATALANARLPKRTVDALPEFEERVLDRLRTDSGFAAELLASPETAIRSLDADDPISDLFALPPAPALRRTGRTLAPVGFASLRIEATDGSSDGGN